MHQGVFVAGDGALVGIRSDPDGDRQMTRSTVIKTAWLAAGALAWVTGLCQAQSPASGHTEQESATHRDIAKSHLKGELLAGYNKALRQSSSAALAGAEGIRADAEAAAQCNAVLEKMVPHMQNWTARMKREYQRLLSENQALHAEYARLQKLPKWAQKYQLEADYQRKLARHLVAYRVYLAQRQARGSMLLGMRYCLRVIQKHDPALAARWSSAIGRLQAGR
jgi:hypothetical protein